MKKTYWFTTMMKYFLLASILFVSTIAPLWAQIPYVTKHLPKHYGGGGQSWRATQGKQGLIYIADNVGVLQYDGVQWHKFSLNINEQATAVRSHNDTLFVGTHNGIGYLGYDSTRKNRRYVSLMHLIPPKQRKNGRVDDILPLDKGVAFMNSRGFVWVYQQGKCTYVNYQDLAMYDQGQPTLLAKSPKRWLYFNQHLYVVVGQSLFVWNGAKFTKTDELQGFKYLANIAIIKNYRKDTLLAYDHKIRQMRWLYLQKGKFKATKVFQTQLDTMFAKKHLKDRHFKVLESGMIALSDYHNLRVLDKNGQIQRMIKARQDIPTISIYSFMEDKQGNLWTMGEQGIGQVHNQSPCSFWDTRHGVSSETTFSVIYDHQTLYVGTSKKLLHLNKQGYFEKIKEVADRRGWVSGFLKHQGQLYAVGLEDVYEVHNGQVKPLVKQFQATTLTAFKSDSSKLLLGTYQQGLFLMTHKQERWTKQKVKGYKISPRIYTIKEGKDESLWTVDTRFGVFRVWLNAAKDSVIKQVHYTTQDGLPSNALNFVFQLRNGQLVFGTSSGIYAFDQAKEYFYPHPVLNPYVKGKQVYHLYETQQGHIFVQMEDESTIELVMLKMTENKGYAFVKKTFMDVQISSDKEYLTIAEKDGQYVINKGTSLVVYNASWPTQQALAYPAIIRKVTINNDSLLFNENNLRAVSLHYEFNTLRFDYVALFYAYSHKNQYQFRLKGFQDKWSSWSRERHANFTNLPEGKYLFEVRAKNVYGDLSQTARFSFQIEPPWYRTWWAYVLYVSSTILLMLVVLRLNSRRLIKQKERLEHKVQERTIALRQKQEKVSQQNEELQQQQEEISMQNKELQQQQEEITAQRDAIEQKNIQVRKSIEAAKLIQDAILPFEDRMQEIFQHYFVLFRPRDIVSGDFYWVDRTKDGRDIRLVAAVDCTGHGVPGAFMSMMGYALLNEIVHQKNITRPASILECLRTNLKHALKREKTGNQSGMDLGLCSIQYLPNDTVEVAFAGAKCPMYYFRKASQELCELKGSRISIGIRRRKPRNFEEHSLILQPGDLIFLSTDGYCDQNNAARKRLGSQCFQELLASQAHQPLPQQKKALEHALETYTTGTEQRDDILVIGVRL
ncbi:Two component regulator three Y motif family [Microscilla marina ATCC 23134]|uniref:Two component regulator three Y motif family n=2 Tax=Microscilla marina TaxID=1027 RepID=A1ZZ14_MICM2|nr:Two component regulator three Y motif family [Microscilla marina ATCC 23134]